MSVKHNFVFATNAGNINRDTFKLLAILIYLLTSGNYLHVMHIEQLNLATYVCT